jgi:hypothetical protein
MWKRIWFARSSAAKAADVGVIGATGAPQAASEPLKAPFPPRTTPLQDRAPLGGPPAAQAQVIVRKSDVEAIHDLADGIRDSVQGELERRAERLIGDVLAEPIPVIELETGGHFGHMAVFLCGKEASESELEALKGILTPQTIAVPSLSVTTGSKDAAQGRLLGELEATVKNALAPDYEVTRFEHHPRGTKFSDIEETGWERAPEASVAIRATDPVAAQRFVDRQTAAITALFADERMNFTDLLREAIECRTRLTDPKEPIAIRVLGLARRSEWDEVVTIGKVPLALVHSSSSLDAVAAAKRIIDNAVPFLRTALVSEVRKRLPPGAEIVGLESNGSSLSVLVRTAGEEP